MNTLELLKQRNEVAVAEAALDEQIQNTARVAQELGVTVLGSEGSLSASTVEELEERKDEEARRELQWILSLRGTDIEDSFGTPRVPEPTAITESSYAEQEPGDSQKPKESTEAEKLREFNISMVQNITGMTHEEASEAATTLAGLVRTVVMGIAESEKYQQRRVKTRNGWFADPTATDDISFVAMRVNTAAPETFVRIGHTPDGQEIYHVESSLRGIKDLGSCVVLSQIGDSPPEIYTRIYGETFDRKIEDPEEAEQFMLATIATMGRAYENHRPENDEAAKKAAKDARLQL